ncbi:MAG TPA: hypothetical protein VLJ76_01275 [Gaiellaceae bacterium]|nr:hypothetical protein [Gaiellaceae bacterium]
MSRSGGVEGNERLTSTVGLVLVLLLGAEAVTAIDLHDLLPVHLFLGMLLLPPVALKLASTGWRFTRYYTRNARYREAGPPRWALRLLAPELVVSGLLLFGTGVAFLLVGHGGGWLLTIHAGSFVAFGVLVSIHTLAYLSRVLRLGFSDWRLRGPRPLGSGLRRAALIVALVAGVAVAGATYTVQSSWISHRHHHHHDFRDAAR